MTMRRWRVAGGGAPLILRTAALLAAGAAMPLAIGTAALPAAGAATATAGPGSRTAPAATIRWLGWTEGLATAQKQGRLLLVYFHKPDCKFCDRMDAETFGDARVKAAVNACFVPARVESFDPTAFTGPGGEKLSGVALRRRYRVATFPTVIALASGEPSMVLMRVPGFFGPRDFLDTLAYVTEGWHRRMPFGEFLEERMGGRLPPPPGGARC